MRETLHQLFDLPRRLPVRRFDVAIQPRVAHDLDRALEVVEDEERVGEEEDRLREALRIGFRHRQLLVVTGDFVGQVADGAAMESRQPFDGHRIEAAHLLFDGDERVAVAGRSSRCTRYGSVPMKL